MLYVGYTVYCSQCLLHYLNHFSSLQDHFLIITLRNCHSCKVNFTRFNTKMQTGISHYLKRKKKKGLALSSAWSVT